MANRACFIGRTLRPDVDLFIQRERGSTSLEDSEKPIYPYVFTGDSSINRKIPMIIGVPRDVVIKHYIQYLQENKISHIFVNLDYLKSLVLFEESYCIINNNKIDYDMVSGILNRVVGFKDEETRENQLEFLMYLLNHTFKNVYNRPFYSNTNNSKPYQLHVIKKVAKNIKIATTQIFANLGTTPNLNGEIIYKSVSGIRSLASVFNPINDNRPISCPTLFQKRIFGNNVRVHVVQDKLISQLITSTDVDYRYPSGEEETSYKVVDLPDPIKDDCFKISKELNLRLTGIDLMLTDNGDFYFLEANPSPGFSHYEKFMEEKTISKYIADSLMG